MRAWARALILCLSLSGCSQHTELSARFIDGEVGFVALGDVTVDCVQSLAVIDVASQEVMWEIGDAGTGTCQGALPILYGQRNRGKQREAKPLVPGRRYEVSGSASGGNSLDGRFRLTRATALRLTDLAWDQRLDGRGMSIDIANEMQ